MYSLFFRALITLSDKGGGKLGRKVEKVKSKYPGRSHVQLMMKVQAKEGGCSQNFGAVAEEGLGREQLELLGLVAQAGWQLLRLVIWWDERLHGWALNGVGDFGSDKGTQFLQ